MPLFVNQSAVSERENSRNPQRGVRGLEEGMLVGVWCTAEVVTSNSFSESCSFSGLRFLGVHGCPRAAEKETHVTSLLIPDTGEIYFIKGTNGS